MGTAVFSGRAEIRAAADRCSRTPGCDPGPLFGVLHRLLAEQEIHLIFLDLMMPEMDGITFLEKKGGDKDTATIPVMVTTALSEEAGV